MATVVLDHLTKTYGESAAVNDVSLRVESGESVVLLGPSGCGKTTTLRMVAGFETPTSGRIQIGDTVVAQDGMSVPPEERQVGMVFQSYALWPHLSVADNIGFGLTTKGGRRRLKQSKPEIAESVEQALAQVQLDGFGKRFPHELSGGQQQRVALARALVTNPGVLLLDEPLSNLDTRLREDMRLEIRRIQQESGITMIYITHDRTEALGLADRIVSLRLGEVQQVGPPEELYQQPVSQFVAESLGPANVLDATVIDSTVIDSTPSNPGHQLTVALATGQKATFTAPRAAQAGDRIRVCVRPHDTAIGASTGKPNAVVATRSFLGDETHYVLTLTGSQEQVRVFDRTMTRFEPGTPVTISVAEHKLSVLSDEPLTYAKTA